MTQSHKYWYPTALGLAPVASGGSLDGLIHGIHSGTVFVLYVVRFCGVIPGAWRGMMGITGV